MFRSEGSHVHKCGYTIYQNDPVAVDGGCGHEWTHKASELNNSVQWQAGHACPKCGKGPWVWKYDPSDVCDSFLPINFSHVMSILERLELDEQVMKILGL